MDVMRKSRLSCHQQNLLFEHFAAGITGFKTACLCGVHRNTSAYYFHYLREIFFVQIETEDKDVFGGEIEITNDIITRIGLIDSSNYLKIINAEVLIVT